jgi:hypothetical protein
MKNREEMMALRESIVDSCLVCLDADGNEHGPCERIDGNKCKAYISPKMWWDKGKCPLATHWVDPTKAVKKRVRIGQQKQRRW